MAKRNRGKRGGSVSSANPRSFGELISEDGGAAVPDSVPDDEPRVQEKKRAVDTSVNWSSEYKQVFSDLKQLLVISVSLFALMIVLGLMI